MTPLIRETRYLNLIFPIRDGELVYDFLNNLDFYKGRYLLLTLQDKHFITLDLQGIQIELPLLLQELKKAFRAYLDLLFDSFFSKEAEGVEFELDAQSVLKIFLTAWEACNFPEFKFTFKEL